MLEAMFKAEVGDDVLEEDPTVKQLEAKMAKMFGHQAAIFCPSGTMTNQIAIRVLTQPQDEVICDTRSHIYHYEGGGVAYNSMVSMRLLNGDRGRLSAADIAANVNPDDIHHPITRLVSLENTVNRGGGSYYRLPQVADINKTAREHKLRMHLDGARLFNALVETGETPHEWGSYFDTISICLSKGLGAPVGSVLIGSSEIISKAMRVRKVLGGAMRQCGYLAAAGIYALDHHIDLLPQDHSRARELGAILIGCPVVEQVDPVDTNIVIFDLKRSIDPEDFLGQLENEGILALSFGGSKIRLVTHHEINDDMIGYFQETLNRLYQ